MFTGLVRDIGVITRLEQQGDLLVEITPSQPDFPIAMGASIACNGICLTVTSMPQGAFTAQLSAETVRVTNAGNWQVGTRLNLEPSLRVGDEIGGHFVSGHVDGLGRVAASEPSGDSTIWSFEAPAELMKFIAKKGSIVVNGVSLTVNEVSQNRFLVNIIPHTAAATTFGQMQVGDRVNLEVDLLARYVARMQECA